MLVCTLHLDLLSALHIHVLFLVLYDRRSLFLVLSCRGFLFCIRVFHYMCTHGGRQCPSESRRRTALFCSPNKLTGACAGLGGPMNEQFDLCTDKYSPFLL
jgi:hypothetical protein